MLFLQISAEILAPSIIRYNCHSIRATQH